MPAHSKPSRTRWIPLLGLGFLLLAGLVYAGAYLRVGGGVLPNTTVAGVPVGGLSPAAAVTKLTRALTPRTTAPLNVQVRDQSLTIEPRSAGLTVDFKATVAATGRRTATPVGLWNALFGKHDVAPAVAVDTTKLAASVDQLDRTLRGAGRDGGIRFDGVTPVAISPVRGIGIVKNKAMAALRSAYLSSTRPVDLPVEIIEPNVSDAEVQRVLTTIARPAVAGPVVLVAGSTTFQVTPAMIARNLRFEAANGKLVPVVDGHGIAASLPAGALSALETPAKNASFDVSSGTPVIVPSVTGGTADLERLGPAIAAVLSQAKPVRVDVPATGIEAAFTTAAAQRLGIKQLVSTFTTHHPCCAARVHNIHTIADIVNGHLILPGETFSLNKFVGPRDTRRGFVEAPMIEDGLFINSVGGGVSQFATTMYNAVFFAALKDIEHHPHSYYISRYPAGREATVSYPNPNLIFQNDTATGILVTTSYTGTSLTVTFWGTKYYDVASTASGRYKPTTAGIRYNTRPDCERASGGSGFQIDVTQTLSRGGVVVKKNVLHTRYDAEPVIICGASPTPTPPASSSATGSPTSIAGALGVAPSTPPSPKPSPRSSPRAPTPTP